MRHLRLRCNPLFTRRPSHHPSDLDKRQPKMNLIMVTRVLAYGGGAGVMNFGQAKEKSSS